MKTSALELQRTIGEPAEIGESRDIQHAVKRIALAQPHFVIADAKLPSWDLHVLHDKIRSDTAVLLLEPDANPMDVAMAIDQRRPRPQTPSF